MQDLKFNSRVSLFLISLLVILSNSGVSLFAQVNAGGEPISSLTQLSSNFQTALLSSVNTKKAMEEDAAVSKYPGMPFRYGLVIPVNYDLNNSGSWESLPDGSRVWRLGIKTPDAKSLNLFFDNFYVPKGAFMFVYDLNKRRVLGSFTEINNSVDGKFATAVTPGNCCVVEYYEPVYDKNKARLNLTKVIYAYKDITGDNPLVELPCEINVNCPAGAPWVNQKRAVARMTYIDGGDGYLCTGSLVNNTLNNQIPYFLTAQHCESDNWSSLVADFNFESPTCNGVVSGSFQSVSGAVSMAENYDTDFRLLQLNNSVPASANAFFNGWDNSGIQPQNETGIHHPDGVVKKISHDTNQASNSNGFGGRLPNGFWQVVWEDGLTEGGSSGSPLYDQNKRAIGQLLGGPPVQCVPQSNIDIYGKFSESWAHGGSPTNQLKNWLDPNNSGVKTLDGIDALTGVAPFSNFTSDIQSLPIGGGGVNFFDLSTNSPMSWSWSFPGGNPQTSTQRNPAGITYSATGAYTVSLTTTNTFGSNLKTIVNYVRVAGVPLSIFTLQSPPSGSTVFVYSPDTTLKKFIWGTSNPSPTVKYIFRIKRLGPYPETSLPSDNGGLDTVISLRQGYLDSLAVTFGTTGDSVHCTWRALAANGLDTLSSPYFLVRLRIITVGINQISSVVPEKFDLYNNYPNPFNPKTTIKFDISKPQIVKLKVYSLLGEEIATLVNQDLTTGSYSVDFDASYLSSGMYFYRIETPGFSETKRMALVK